MAIFSYLADKFDTYLFIKLIHALYFWIESGAITSSHVQDLIERHAWTNPELYRASYKGKVFTVFVHFNKISNTIRRLHYSTRIQAGTSQIDTLALALGMSSTMARFVFIHSRPQFNSSTMCANSDWLTDWMSPNVAGWTRVAPQCGCDTLHGCAQIWAQLHDKEVVPK